MNIMIVDDEELMLTQMRRMVRQVASGENPSCFTTVKEAYTYAKEHPVDVAFLDIQMGDVNGIELAKALKKIKPDVNLIFVTGHPEYMGAAFKLYASGFVEKPVYAEYIKRELEHLRHKPASPQPKLPESVGAFTFDHDHGRVYRDEAEVPLTPKEYKLLLNLAMKPGEFITAQELYEKTYGMKPLNDMHPLHVLVSRLRKNLGLIQSDKRAGIDIEQQRGGGYRLVVHAMFI